jgi:hypothetical protein
VAVSQAQALQRLADAVGDVRRELRRLREQRDLDRWESPPQVAYREARRRPLRHLDVRAFAAAIPGLAGRFARVIPAAAWAQIADGVAQVSCPCRAAPECPIGVPQPCGCGRAYLFTGEHVRVAFSPAGVADQRS